MATGAKIGPERRRCHYVPRVTSSPLACRIITPPGLEAVTAGELAALGLTPGEIELGGIEVPLTPSQLADALIRLRTASRIVVRVASFRARTFAELERHAATVPWVTYLPAGMAVHLRVTSHKSRLYHQQGIAERIGRVIMGEVAGCQVIPAAGEAEELDGEPRQLSVVQRILVRLWRDEVTISCDAAGALLHRRGWRQGAIRAPLRETLAAAMLLGAEWDGGVPLVDPMMGSGTIVIEAARLVRRIAPGRERRFVLEAWPGMSPTLVPEARARARAEERSDLSVSIMGSDRDAGAVRSAVEHAERAGVASDVMLSCAPLTALPPDDGPGLLLTNPPYGARLGDLMRLRDLYAALGALPRRRPHWSLAFLATHPRLVGQVRLPMVERWRSTNGGIPVRLLHYQPPVAPPS